MKLDRKVLIGACYLLVFLGWSSLLAEEVEKSSELEGLSVELISDHSTITAGQPFLVGFHIKHQKGYHTYWKNPGLVGLATNLKWKVPEGYTVSGLKWPYPELSSMAGNPCYGYERDVTLYVTVTPPKEVTAKKVNISVDAIWMCCADSCFPGNESFSIDLAVDKKAVVNNTHLSLFNLAKEQMPASSSTLNTKLLSDSTDQSIRLKVSAMLPKNLEEVYLFSEDGQVSSAEKQVIEKQSNGSWVITSQRCEFSPKKVTNLPSVLRLGDKYYRINPAY